MAIQTYLQFNDPVVFHWRKGDASDPYKHRYDSLPVINNIITLLEVPSESHRVKISGLTEISQETYERVRQIGENQFLVNYSNGIIQFHPKHEGKTFLVEYYGRGFIMYPASRVYALVQRSPDIVKTLQDIIDESKRQLNETQIAIDYLQVIIQNAINATNNANTATDNANLARDKALEAAQKALDARDTTVMIYKEPVQTYEDLFTTYPNPESGWRVMVKETGDIYRYDGINGGGWQLIENWTGGAIPLASETTDGLMRSEDYTKFHEKLEYKTMVFVIPNTRSLGIQKPIIRFPYDGEIVSAYAFSLYEGVERNTVVSVEKISESDFLSDSEWSRVCDIILATGENKSSHNLILDPQIQAGDYFRVNLFQADDRVTSFNLQIEVKI